MKKMKLQFDALQVETFETFNVLDEKGGTVRAFQSEESLFSPERTCAYSCLEPSACYGSCINC